VVNQTESENEVAGEKAWSISIIVGSFILLILLIVLLALAAKKNK
jgi:flagellar biogenesis protein FliO